MNTETAQKLSSHYYDAFFTKDTITVNIGLFCDPGFHYIQTAQSFKGAKTLVRM